MLAAGLGIATDSSAAELPRYEWETLVETDLLSFTVSSMNSRGDVVGRAYKFVTLEHYDEEDEIWYDAERRCGVQVVYFKGSEEFEELADWGELAEEKTWPEGTMGDLNRVLKRYPVVLDTEGRAWALHSFGLEDMNDQRMIAGAARLYELADDAERYENVCVARPVLVTPREEAAANGSRLEILDLREVFESLDDSDIDWKNVDWSGARAINDLGDVAGRYRMSGTSFRGFYASWKNGAWWVVDIGAFSEYAVSVYGMNSLGQIVGDASIDSSTRRAFRWSADDGQMENLGVLSNRHGSSHARAINDLGQVVGFSDTKMPHYGIRHLRAFRYTDGVGMVGLGPDTRSASDINNYGDVIGSLETSDGQRTPFLYTDANGLLELEPLIEDLPGVLGRLYAWRITDNGEIFLSHDQLPDGRTELVILRPITEEPGVQVTIVEPYDFVVSGEVLVAAEATSPDDIKDVTFVIEGGNSTVILNDDEVDFADGVWYAYWDSEVGDDGTYTIRAVATDSQDRVAEDQIVVLVDNEGDVPPPPEDQEMTIEFKDVGSKQVGRNHWQASVRVTVSAKDGNGNELDDALVTGTWSDGNTETFASGELFESNQIHRRINSVTFTVTDVELAGDIWNQDANVPTWIEIPSPLQ